MASAVPPNVSCVVVIRIACFRPLRVVFTLGARFKIAVPLVEGPTRRTVRRGSRRDQANRSTCVLYAYTKMC
jgi:hypothetical protein